MRGVEALFSLPIVLAVVINQVESASVAGDVVLVTGNMAFGVWIGGQENSAPAKQENVDSKTSSESTVPFEATSQISTEYSTIEPSKTSTTPEPSTTSTTVAPPPECPGYTTVAVTGISQVESTITIVSRDSFEECCSGTYETTNSFSYMNGTCTYYSYWFDHTSATQEGIPGEDADLFYTRTEATIPPHFETSSVGALHRSNDEYSFTEASSYCSSIKNAEFYSPRSQDEVVTLYQDLPDFISDDFTFINLKRILLDSTRTWLWPNDDLFSETGPEVKCGALESGYAELQTIDCDLIRPVVCIQI